MSRGGLTPEQIKDGVEFIRNNITDAYDNQILERQRELLQQRFGDAPIPQAVVDGVVNSAETADDYNVRVLYVLAKIRGVEVLPWIESSLKSESPFVSGVAAEGLLYIDEARGIEEIGRLFEDFIWAPNTDPGFYAGWFIEELEEAGSPACLTAAQQLLERGREVVKLKKEGASRP